MTNSSAKQFLFYREDIMEFKFKTRTPLYDITKAAYKQIGVE